MSTLSTFVLNIINWHLAQLHLSSSPRFSNCLQETKLSKSNISTLLHQLMSASLAISSPLSSSTCLQYSILSTKIVIIVNIVNITSCCLTLCSLQYSILSTRYVIITNIVNVHAINITSWCLTLLQSHLPLLFYLSALRAAGSGETDNANSITSDQLISTHSQTQWTKGDAAEDTATQTHKVKDKQTP